MTQSTSASSDEADGKRLASTQILISAARQLLTEGQSYPEITVQQLAEKAGIPRWRFYEHFTDKYDLLKAWFAELNEHFEQDHNAWLQIDGSVTYPALREAVAELFLPYREHSSIHGAMYDSAATDHAIRALLEATERRRIDAVRDHIDRGQSEGWIDPSLDSSETSSWIVLTGVRTYQQCVSIENGLAQDEFIEGFARFVWYVLYEPARH